jgi:hypothetical protein
MHQNFSLYVNGDLTELNARLADGWSIDRHHTQTTPYGILYVLNKYIPETQNIGIDVPLARIEREISTLTAPVEYNYTTRR